ncbi:MAG TPA: FAD-dependent oxidoreductase [Rectinemataceae bacterium]|nr:FAD-dependent oxidoreductase [Rectinemataceae bacterium]
MEARFSIFGAEAEPLSLLACAVRKNGIRVCVIGGGGTGIALAYDLAQRGFSVTLLEKGELTSGTTGRHHGQLHCGARYAWADRNIARECYAESLVLARIAGECIEYNGGFFLAMTDEEEALEKIFIERCLEAGIPARSFDIARLAIMEPRLSNAVKAAVAVPDGSFDAFRLPLMFASAAKTLGANFLPWHEVIGFDFSGGKLCAVLARNLGSRAAGLKGGGRQDGAGPGRDIRIDCDFAVSATGAWAGRIGALAGVSIPIVPAPGTMVAVKGRLVDHVMSRLRPPGDGDIFVPQRGLSIIGTTQRVVDSPEGILPGREEIEYLRAAAVEMIAGFEAMPVYAAWAAARPLVGKVDDADAAQGDPKPGDAAQGNVAPSDAAPRKKGGQGSRDLSRDFQVLDHGSEHGLEGLLTIIGGKATVLRAMAEKTSDLICAKSGIAAECRTSRYKLPSWRSYFRGAGR